MAQYRKKPAVVSAEQYLSGGPLPEGVCRCEPYSGPDRRLHVHTLEGSLYVSDGDFIVTGVTGERWPIKPDIFALTYEPVEG